jgi:hypothetical protein
MARIRKRLHGKARNLIARKLSVVAGGSGSISDITLNEAHAANDDGRRRLFAGFHVHMHAAPLLRLVGINVGHPFQDDWDP